MIPDPFHAHTCPTCRERWEHVDAECTWALYTECASCYVARRRRNEEDTP